MNLYLALGTGLSGATITEVSDVNYVRQAVSMSSFVGGRTQAMQGVTFGSASSGFGTVASMALFDRPTGGNCLLAWPRSKAAAVAAGKSLTFSTGEIVLLLPDMASLSLTNSSVVFPAGMVAGLTSLGEVVTAGVQLQVTTSSITGVPPAVSASQVNLTDAATVAVDASAGAVFSVTLSGNRTLGFPSNLKAGMILNFFITQGAGGSHTLAYAAGWKFAAATAPVLSTAAGAVDWLQAAYDGVTLAGTVVGKAIA